MRIAIDFTTYGNFSLRQDLHRQAITVHLQILTAGKRDNLPPHSIWSLNVLRIWVLISLKVLIEALLSLLNTILLV